MFDFIAPLALIAFCFYAESYFLPYIGIAYLTLPMLNKWINELKKNKLLQSFLKENLEPEMSKNIRNIRKKTRLAFYFIQKNTKKSLLIL